MIPASSLASAVVSVVAMRLALPCLADGWNLLRHSPRLPLRKGDRQERILVVVPAHDEARTIGRLLRTLHLARPAFPGLVVVIADNCSDDTADVARAEGATCLERFEPGARGKAAAIGWALARVDLREVDAIVVIDADVSVPPDFFMALEQSGPWRTRAGQSRQCLENPDQSALTRLAAIHTESRYGLALPLKNRAGMNCPLTGPGSVIGSELLVAIDWASLGIAEDLELYALLSAAGARIDYVPDAIVYFRAEASTTTSGPQRRRWTVGRATAFLHRGASVLRSDRIGARQKLDVLAELVAPGPVEHAIVTVFAIALLLLTAAPGTAILAAILVASLVRPVAYTALSLARQPKPRASIAALAFLPVYAAWRLALSMTLLPVFLKGRWERTPR